jgi:hypothetical protein
MHSHYLKDCKEGCPTFAAIAKASAAIAKAEGKNAVVRN